MRKDHTDITIVLDRSGSMDTIAKETIGGFNTFLEDQKKAQGTATLTLNQFDVRFEQPVPPTDIQMVKPLTSETFQPRGMTALLDAVGKSIAETGERLRKTAEELRPEKVIFVIMTDGMENASQEYTYEKVKQMIEHQTNIYSWQFMFIGANIDAAKVGGSIGIIPQSTIRYAHNPIGTQSAFASVSMNTMKFRSGNKSAMTFEKEDYDKQEEQGVNQ